MAVTKSQKFALCERSEVLRAYRAWRCMTAMGRHDSEASGQKFSHFQDSNMAGFHKALSLPSLSLVAETRGSNKGTEPTAAGAGTALRNPPRENLSLVNSRHPEGSNDVMTRREDAV